MLSPAAKEYKFSSEDFLSTKEASEVVPYSREHIGRLAREKKVKAAQVGGKWIVSLASLQDFYHQSKIEEDILSERLRAERLVEQNVSDFVFQGKASSLIIFSPYEKVFAHIVSASGVVIVGILFFLSPVFFDTSSNVAQLFNFNQVAETKSVTTFEAVEMTASIDVENGILLFPKQTVDANQFDPMTVFSDEVKVVENEDGVTYVRVVGGESSSDIPFVNLPSSYEYYQEVIDEEITASDF